MPFSGRTNRRVYPFYGTHFHGTLFIQGAFFLGGGGEGKCHQQSGPGNSLKSGHRRNLCADRSAIRATPIYFFSPRSSNLCSAGQLDPKNPSGGGAAAVSKMGFHLVINLQGFDAVFRAVERADADFDFGGAVGLPDQFDGDGLALRVMCLNFSGRAVFF
jgi:hypothetical protein